MGNSNYSNFKAFEGTVTGVETLEFDWRPRSITISNDSASSNLKFKFNLGDSWATLKAGETVNPEIIIRRVYLSTDGANYRVWGIG